MTVLVMWRRTAPHIHSPENSAEISAHREEKGGVKDERIHWPIG